MTSTHQPALEPDEILPPKSGPESPPQKKAGRIHAVMVGLLVDALDLLTMGLVGIRIGFPLGAILTFYLLGIFRLPLQTRILISLAAGAYCAIPFTSLIPLGTLLTILVPRLPPRTPR